MNVRTIAAYEHIISATYLHLALEMPLLTDKADKDGDGFQAAQRFA